MDNALMRLGSGDPVVEYLRMREVENRRAAMAGYGTGALGILGGGAMTLTGDPLLGIPLMMTGVAGMANGNDMMDRSDRAASAASAWDRVNFGRGK